MTQLILTATACLRPETLTTPTTMTPLMMTATTRRMTMTVMTRTLTTTLMMMTRTTMTLTTTLRTAEMPPPALAPPPSPLSRTAPSCRPRSAPTRTLMMDLPSAPSTRCRRTATPWWLRKESTEAETTTRDTRRRQLIWSESQKLNAIVGVLAAIVVLLVLALLGGGYFLYQKTKKM